MITSESKQQKFQRNEEINLLLQLKEKKKQMIQQQQTMLSKIKDYFSDLTIQICNKETSLIGNFKNKLYQFFASIDSYCSMSQSQRLCNRDEIEKILNFQLQIVENKKLKEMLEGNFIDICNDDMTAINATFMSSQHQKTYKKGYDNSFVILKSAYLEQITQLQQKIEKLMLKEQKLKTKLFDMDSKQKMKKLGNAYLPYEEKTVSNLLLQRLQSENKILIQQIADCSQKLLSLRSENSILARQKQCSQNLPTEKKKPSDSIHLVQQSQSVQYTQYQQKITILQLQIENLKTQMQKQKERIILREQQLLKSQTAINEEYILKIQQLKDYNQRLYKQCDENISKKVEFQQKLEQQTLKYESKIRQVENIKQMNQNYGKLIKLKDEKIVQVENQCAKLLIKLKQFQENSKKTYVQYSQSLQIKQTNIKAKQLQIDAIKSALKKQQNQKNDAKQKLTKKQEQLFNQLQKNKNLQTQLIKANKQKQSYAKKQVNKVKKELKKEFEQDKKILIEDFKGKYGLMMQKLEIIKKQMNDNKEKLERKLKIEENRLNLFKDKVAYETKQMFEKVSKPNQKQKLFDIIQAYIQTEATISVKNSQIKLLKDELASKKLIKKDKQPQRAENEMEVNLAIQQFQKQIWQQKLQIQKSLYQSRLNQQKQQYEQVIRQKITTLQAMILKCQNYEKTAKQFKNEINTLSAQTNPQIIQLKKNKQQITQKYQKMETLVNSLKNNVSRLQKENQQGKDQIKLKTDIINGLKKDLKDKQLQKTKLNQTMNSMIQDMEKIKKASKQANKKQAIFTQFKQKLVNQSELSQQICNLKLTLEQRQKMHKAELAKRDQTIKDLKISQQLLNKKLKGQNILQQQIIDLKQKMKKNRLQIQRKDTLIQHLKEKQEKANNQTAVVCEANQNQQKKLKKQLQVQKSKLQSMKIKQRKLQSNYQLVKISLIKVYQKLCSKANFVSIDYNTTTTKMQNKKTRYQFTVQKTPQSDLSKYNEGLSILQISSQDLDIGTNKTLQPYSPIPYKTQFNISNQDISKLTQLLQSPEIDSVPILALFNLVLE